MKTRHRFPWLSIEDMKVLAQLPPDAAEAFKRTLRADYRAHERDALSRPHLPLEEEAGTREAAA